MSLLVWLPLTGNINNQGLAASLTTTNTPVYKTTGKIGSCLDLNTRVQFSCPDLSNLQTFSIAFWAKVNADSSLTTNWVDVIGFTDVHTNGTSGQLRWETCYGSGYENRGISGYDNATYATTNGPNGGATAGGKGVWNHIVCTVENGVEVKEYRDGVLTGTYSSNGGHLNGTFWLGETGKVNGEINDVRIYDEALSPLEVKRLSQALVLHYPLNDRYIEPTTNLCNVQTVSNATGSVWGNHTTNRTVVDATNYCIPTSQCMRVDITVDTTVSTSGGNGWTVQGAIPAQPNTTYTYSGYFKASDDFAYTHANLLYRYEYTGDTWSSSTRVTEGGVFNKSRMESVGDGWYRCWGTFTTKDTTNWLAIYFYTYPGKDVSYLVGAWQLEQKDHMTPYILGMRNETAVYDASGFNNNGYIYRYDTNSIVETSTDTPRSSASTVVSSANATINAAAGTAYIVGDISLITPSQLTVTFWVNPLGKGYGNSYGQGIFCTTAGTSSGTDYLVSAMNSYDDYLRVNSGSDYYARPRFVISEGWHHYAATFDGQTARVYKDGVQTASAAMSASSTLGSFDHIFFGYSRAGGVWRRNNCQWSDCRIYATALSADDIKALYEDSAYIATDGTAYAYEFVEE